MPRVQPPSDGSPQVSVEPTKRDAPHYEFIDALRGWAIIGVIVYHTALRFPSFWGKPVCMWGNYGVQLFYVVSAFSLMLSLQHRSAQDGNKLYTYYLLRRFFRIAPMFYVAVLIHMLYAGYAPRGTASTGITNWHLLTTLTFTNGWIPSHINAIIPGGWSVAIETSFYLLLPLAFRYIRSTRAAASVSLLALAAGVALNHSLRPLVRGLVVDAHVWDSFQYYWLPAHAGVFGLGIVLFFVCLRRQPDLMSKSVRARCVHSWAAVFIGLGVVATVMLVAAVPWKHFFISIGFMVVSYALAVHPNKLCVNPITVLIGRVSFSAYLLHPIVIDLSSGAAAQMVYCCGRLSFILTWAIVCISTVLLSYVTYRAIELPGQAVGKRLIRWLKMRSRSRTPIPQPVAA